RLRNPPRDELAKGEQSDQTESLTFTFSIRVEPRLVVLGTGAPILTEAIDDQNRSLALDSASDKSMPDRLIRHRFMRARWGSGNGEESSQVNLRPPAKDARMLKRIRGALPVYLRKETKTLVVVADMKTAEGKKYQQDGLSFEIEQFRAR